MACARAESRETDRGDHETGKMQSLAVGSRQENHGGNFLGSLTCGGLGGHDARF